MDKKKLRESIFRHLDGIVTAPVISALSKKNVLDFINENQTLELFEINEKFNSNEGYLNVALRVLASQGFLDYHLDNETDVVKISINSSSVPDTCLFSFIRASSNLRTYRFSLSSLPTGKKERGRTKNPKYFFASHS